MLANILIDYFLKGGPIMYPILVVAIVAVCVVGERAFWWLRLGMRRDHDRLEKVLAAMENGDFKAATGLAKDSDDPVVRMIWHGLNHYHHSSLQGALQVAAGVELQKAGRFLTVMDTSEIPIVEHLCGLSEVPGRRNVVCLLCGFTGNQEHNRRNAQDCEDEKDVILNDRSQEPHHLRVGGENSVFSQQGNENSG